MHRMLFIIRSLCSHLSMFLNVIVELVTYTTGSRTTRQTNFNSAPALRVKQGHVTLPLRGPGS